ncbi:unnamed protein product [Clavelina lepadiformis]|uniref:Uncharacterized protein n=2 Tax=Clavelina lepadiformis TaxID=159417 RepID=A0ABP0GUG0_CLALP
MHSNCLIVFSIFLLFDVARCSYQTITECPEMCVCENTICKRRGKSRRLECSGVAVSCYGKGLDQIPPGIPANVTGLSFSNNNFRVIDLDYFSNFTRLTDLIVNENNATELRIGRDIRSLKRLTLKGNQLTALPPKGLTKIKNLLTLDLENNQIQDIRGVRFPRKLDLLNLNHNQLRALPAGIFRKSKLLRVLKLNNNRIDTIHNRAFKYLIGLESLEMEGNLLRTLHKDAFTGLPKAWYLNLKNNRISDIHPMSFRLFGFKNEFHHQIHLENNKLRFFDRDLLGIFITRENHYSFHFAGNPIFCDCNLINVRDEVKHLIGDTPKMVCDSPEENRGTNVNVLEIETCCF